MSTLYRMKEQLASIGAELKSVSEEVRTLVTDPTTKLEEIRERQKYQGEIQERFNLLRAEVEKEESDIRSKMMIAQPTAYANTDEQRMKVATAEFIRAGFTDGNMSDESRNLLGAIPTPNASGGEKLLPTNMQNTLISEPLAKNPLRGVVCVTSIKGLELPKIAYTIDDDDFITDDQTAKEIKLKGDKVSFGRHKTKIYARISDTVMHGSDLELTSYVQNALNSGLAAKEKRVMLTEDPKPGEKHMSFFSSDNGIKNVSGSNMYKAIKAAIADLHEDYRENAKIVMKFSDYLDIIEILANNNAVLYSAPPEQILGKPVVFCDSAVNPIVGDFNYSRLNYDGPMIYDNDKDVKSGEYLFVITAWYDAHVLLESAFRIAVIGVEKGE